MGEDSGVVVDEADNVGMNGVEQSCFPFFMFTYKVNVHWAHEERFLREVMFL